ncbi:MAG: carbohydrate kinase [Rhodothermia bacterium]|nr:carbohydrate kinase [Rhodothermia bacterium]
MTYKTVAIGEVLWDLFPDERRPGGAPSNVAYHATLLGDRGAIVTRVGADVDGEDLITFLEKRSVDVSGVQRDKEHPTGTVQVSFVEGEPHYVIVENVAWDFIEPTEAAMALVREADAICYGTLVQRSPASRHAVHELLLEARGRALVVLDVNLRPPFVDARVLEASLKRSDMVKMSAAEVETVSDLLGKPDLIAWLLEETEVAQVCTTYGKDGAAITTKDGRVAVPGVAVDTSDGDFVGVGDSFIAAMTHKLVRESDPEEALRFANRYAALVATRRGAMPKISDVDLARISD